MLVSGLWVIRGCGHEFYGSLDLRWVDVPIVGIGLILIG